MSTPRRLFSTLILSLALIGCGRNDVIVCETSVINADMNILKAALLAYHKHLHEFPTGDSEQVFRALAGKNSARVKILESAEPHLDPWKREFLFIPRKDKSRVVIRSAGPDLKYWTHDDIVSEVRAR